MVQIKKSHIKKIMTSILIYKIVSRDSTNIRSEKISIQINILFWIDDILREIFFFSKSNNYYFNFLNEKKHFLGKITFVGWSQNEILKEINNDTKIETFISLYDADVTPYSFYEKWLIWNIVRGRWACTFLSLCLQEKRNK